MIFLFNKNDVIMMMNFMRKKGEEMIEKKAVGEAAAQYVKDGMIVGLGTGSTVYYTIQKVGEYVKEGMNIRAIPTSEETKKLALDLNIPLVTFAEVNHLDVVIDGADEVDCHFALTKGGGGALLREKLIADATDLFIVVADSSKIVEKLGKFPLPVEVTPFSWERTARQIEELGSITTRRLNGTEPYISDNGNYILDCSFEVIEDPEGLSQKLNRIPGVVENGLFVNMAKIVFTVEEGKVVKKMK